MRACVRVLSPPALNNEDASQPKIPTSIKNQAKISSITTPERHPLEKIPPSMNSWKSDSESTTKLPKIIP